MTWLIHILDYPTSLLFIILYFTVCLAEYNDYQSNKDACYCLVSPLVTMFTGSSLATPCPHNYHICTSGSCSSISYFMSILEPDWPIWLLTSNLATLCLHWGKISNVSFNTYMLFMFAAWLFWTFHTKSHNMKALVILSHSWWPFLPITCLYGKNELLWVSVQPSGVFV